jgi:hypothetical protein
MSTEVILAETFAAHEYLAPPAHELWPGIEHGIRARRRRRVVVGAFAAVAVVGGGGAVAGGALPGTGAPAKPGTSAGAPTGSSGSSTPSNGTLSIPIQAGWLPPGAVEEARFAVYGRTGLSYLVNGNQYVMLNTGEPDGIKEGPGTPTTVNGRPATEWTRTTGQYSVRFALPSGTVVSVSVMGGGPGSTGADRRSIGRRVAASITDGHHLLVSPLDYTISAFPPGLALRGISRAMSHTIPRGTVYTLAAPGTTHPVPASQQVQVSTNRDGIPRVGQVWDAAGHRTRVAVAGRPVQGHPTVVASWTGGVSLWIPGLLPGVTIEISGGSEVSTLAQLYALADSIRPAR